MSLSLDDLAQALRAAVAAQAPLLPLEGPAGLVVEALLLLGAEIAEAGADPVVVVAHLREAKPWLAAVDAGWEERLRARFGTGGAR